MATSKNPGLREDEPFPSPQTLLIQTPLYEKFRLSAERNDWTPISKLMTTQYSVDAYCPGCGHHSVFLRNSQIDIWTGANPHCAMKDVVENRVFELHFFCTRNYDHTMVFQFMVMDGVLTKIGMYPPLAELHLAELSKYKKVLGERHSELTRGVGLAAHGIGIGSFVYLRRIFEHLIDEAAEAERKRPGWNEEAFLRLRMDEKIQAIHHQLPSFLVQNKSLYGILSKGVHELDEDECLAYYPTVKAAIELILDQKLHVLQQAEKMSAATKAISAISGSLKSGK